MAIVIRTDNKRRDLVEFEDLPAKLKKDHADWASPDTKFVVYKGYATPLENFMKLPKHGDLATEGWDGAAADSYFSGLLIKIVDHGEAVVVGTYVEKG